MKQASRQELENRILDLQSRLEESEQLIEAIKAGEVDAFAINRDSESEIYTLQSGDYAYRILIEEFGEGALNVTEDGLIVYTNPYFCELLQLPYEQVIGAAFSDFIQEDSREVFEELFHQSLTGRSKGEINLVSNTLIIPVSLSLTSLQPNLATVGIIVTDYTEKKANENVIIQYQKNLEDNNLELRHSNAELASFAYIASHDLQEPLRKIQTFASRLMEKETMNLSKAGLDYFNRMQIAANRMQNLIEDLLTYSRTNNPERKFVRSDLNSILEEVKIELNEELQAHHTIIETNGMCKADIIPFQFKQLLNNLISNSIKFAKSTEPPHIYIKSEILQPISQTDSAPPLFEGPYCHIQVTDNGIGFDQHYSGKIFELFQRLHGKTEYAGTGIGLAIVKKIVDNHNGIIKAHSEPDKGATFDIYLPNH